MKKIVLALLVVLIVFASAFAYALTEDGCSAEGGGMIAKYAYVVNELDNNVSQYTIGADGALTPMTPATVAAGKSPIPIAVHPSGKYAYVVNYGSNYDGNNVSQYTIGSDGALTPMATPVAAGLHPVSIAVDPLGKYAYVTNWGGNNVSQYTIGSDGALTPMTTPTVAAGVDPFSIAVHPSGKYAYVANSLSNNVSQYTIGSDGALTSMATPVVAAGMEPLSITVDPSGKYAYVANEFSYNVSQYTISSDGTLTPMTSATVAAELNPTSIAVDPSGKFAYVANRLSNNVSQYTIGADGALTPMATPAVAAGTRPHSITVDPSGKYAYVANWTSNGSVSQYTIGVDGALTPMTPVTVATGAWPISVTTVGYKCQDNTPPSTTSMVSGKIGNNGWYISDVTISLTATDTDSDVKEIHYTIDGAETVITGSIASASINGDGTHSFTYYAVDKTGNKETPHALTIKIDKTSPTITASATPAANAYGWNNTNVTVMFTCNDATSGVASCTGPITVTTEGANQVITGTAVDNAGNTATASVTLNIDKTTSSIVNLSVNPGLLWPPNHKMVDVLIGGTATDSGSGVASIEITVADEYRVYNMTVPGFGSTIQLEAWREGTDRDGRRYIITAVVTDKAGNRSTAMTEVLVPHDMR